MNEKKMVEFQNPATLLWCFGCQFLIAEAWDSEVIYKCEAKPGIMGEVDFLRDKIDLPKRCTLYSLRGR